MIADFQIANPPKRRRKNRAEPATVNNVFVREEAPIISAAKSVLPKVEETMILTAAKSVLPEVEPTFLMQVWENARADPALFNALIAGCIERNDYPKVLDNKNKPHRRLWNSYVQNFDLFNYVKCVKDPVDKFITNANKTAADFKYVEKFLKERYSDAVLDLENVYKNQFNSQLAKFCNEYDQIYTPTCTAASLAMDDLPEKFFQEVAFIMHKTEITDHIIALRIYREDLLAQARLDNVLLECQCCFDDLLPDEGIPCPDDHLFCENCVIRACEVKVGDNDLKIKCFTNCDKFFALPVLREVLPPGLMSFLERKHQLEEIAQAQISGLESCQYCEFSYILPEDDKVFVCRNPECLKETCRLCKEPSHIPLRCKEVEKPKDTQVRTRIEETMSEALFRTCYHCKKKFVKVDGCNKMTCQCGAIMCYVCRKPIKDYNHFRDNERKNKKNENKCPLWSYNKKQQEKVILNAGIRAREEELKANPGVNLVHDPTKIRK